MPKMTMPLMTVPRKTVSPMSRQNARPSVGSLFAEDMHRLFKNVVSVVITIGLILLPPLFAWYNTLACWNVFDNTGNLKVAVASADTGYQSDLFPVKVNIGDQVLSSLRANDDIGWVITDEEDAIDGAKAGRYYAAVIIPESFSEDMLTFYSDEGEHADIVYYVNEKASAVAPKITDQGASGVSATINNVFTETLSEISFALAESINDYVQSDESQDALARMTDTLDEVASTEEQTANVIDLYAMLAGSAYDLSQDSANLVSEAEGIVSNASDNANNSAATAVEQAQTLQDSVNSLSDAFSASEASLDEVANSLDSLATSASASSSELAAAMRSQADTIGQQKTQYQTIRDTLAQLRDNADSDQQAAIDSVLTRLDNVISMLDATQTSLLQAADELEQGSTDIASAASTVKAQVDEAKQAVSDLKTMYDTQMKPGLEQIASDAAALTNDISATSDSLAVVQDDLAESNDSITTVLGNTQTSLADASGNLRDQAASLRDLSNRISQAIATGNSEQIQDLLSSDIDVMASALSSPVGIERIAINPSDGFGSGMSPLYSSLAIFIGSLLIVVAIKPTPHDERGKERAPDDPGSTRRFLARLGAVSVISVCQTTLLSLGNIYFLGVQAMHPALYVLCCVLAGLVNTAIMFSLVAAFANLGKALGVILLIMQVTGSGGSFPLELLPSFIGDVSNLLPAYHLVCAMRAAMQGIYNYDYWIQCGELLLFLIPAALIGLVFREPFGRFVQWFVRKADASKLIE